MKIRSQEWVHGASYTIMFILYMFEIFHKKVEGKNVYLLIMSHLNLQLLFSTAKIKKLNLPI